MVQAERRNDRAWLTLDISADLRSVFNWNTKQVSNLLHGSPWQFDFVSVCLGFSSFIMLYVS